MVDVDIATARDPDAPTIVADLAQNAEAVEALAGADVVVHLAAIPAPDIVPDATTFTTNTLSTYNVFAAAALHGFERWCGPRRRR